MSTLMLLLVTLSASYLGQWTRLNLYSKRNIVSMPSLPPCKYNCRLQAFWICSHRILVAVWQLFKLETEKSKWFNKYIYRNDKESYRVLTELQEIIRALSAITRVVVECYVVCKSELLLQLSVIWHKNQAKGSIIYSTLYWPLSSRRFVFLFKQKVESLAVDSTATAILRK